jgi:hypothetical protein
MKKLSFTDNKIIDCIELYFSFELIRDLHEISDGNVYDGDLIYLNITFKEFMILVNSLRTLSKEINENNIIELLNKAAYLYDKILLNNMVTHIEKKYPHLLKQINKDYLKHKSLDSKIEITAEPYYEDNDKIQNGSRCEYFRFKNNIVDIKIVIYVVPELIIDKDVKNIYFDDCDISLFLRDDGFSDLNSEMSDDGCYGCVMRIDKDTRERFLDLYISRQLL